MTSEQKRSLAIIFFTVFLDLVGFGIILPLLPYLAREFSASPFEIGLLMAVFSFMQFLFSPLWGRLSDRFGRRPIILISLFGATFAYIFFAFARELTYLFIAHDLAVVEHISDDVLVMTEGKIVECASSDELYANPQHPYTKKLLAAVPSL